MKIYSGTTLLSVIKGDCIALGADNLVSFKKGDPMIMTKLSVVRNAVVATACMGTLTDEDTDEVLYCAGEWIEQIETGVSLETDAAVIAQFIRETHPFIQLVETEKTFMCLREFQATNGYLTDFLIGSVSASRIMLIRLAAVIDPVEGLRFKETIYFDGHPPISPFPLLRCGEDGRNRTSLQWERRCLPEHARWNKRRFPAAHQS